MKQLRNTAMIIALALVATSILGTPVMAQNADAPASEGYMIEMRQIIALNDGGTGHFDMFTGADWDYRVYCDGDGTVLYSETNNVINVDDELIEITVKEQQDGLLGFLDADQIKGLKGFTYKVYKDRQDVSEPPIYEGACIIIENPDGTSTPIWLLRWPIQDVYTITGWSGDNSTTNQSIIQNIRSILTPEQEAKGDNYKPYTY